MITRGGERKPNPVAGAASQRAYALAGIVALVAVIGLIEVAVSTGMLKDLSSFKTIGLNYGALQRLVAEHFQLAVLLYVAGYGVLGMFMIPGSALVVVLSGLLFGAKIGIPLAELGSALAASLAFAMARLTVGRSLARWSHPALDKLRTGFGRHALSYMLFLRLTPGLPFALINVAPALLGVCYSTFIFGTVVGLLPSRIALSTAGAGLAKVIDAENAQYSQCLAARVAEAAPCAYNIHLASLLTGETIAAFVALALLALSPAIMDAGPRIWRRLTGL